MKVVFTVEMEDEAEVLAFKDFVNEYVEVYDFTILTDTKAMYEKNSNFKKLCSDYKKAKKLRDDFINEHNNKY